MIDHKTVLIVDDDPSVLAAIKRVCRKQPWDILTASNAVDGLRLFETHAVDVVVSDEKMPGLSGVAFLGACRDRRPGCARILLTGSRSADVPMRASQEGHVFQLLTKPCNGGRLAKTIEDALWAAAAPPRRC